MEKHRESTHQMYPGIPRVHGRRAKRNGRSEQRPLGTTAISGLYAPQNKSPGAYVIVDISMRTGAIRGIPGQDEEPGMRMGDTLRSILTRLVAHEVAAQGSETGP
jgi:hypothetical protein